MSDSIKHECGIALIRLLKPLDYYQEKYGTALYGLSKLYLLMEKQHNRGHDGAGIASIKFDPPPGHRYISRKRSNSNQPIKDIFQEVFEPFHQLAKTDPEKLKDPEWLKLNMKYLGEVMMGHLRYGTHGKNSIEACHPFLRQNNWMTRNLVLAGNFNMTNVDELFNQLVNLGQHPKEETDTVIVLEKIGHFLDMANQKVFDKYKKQGMTNAEITDKIVTELNLKKVLTKAMRDFDGGFVMTGLVGHGDAFVLRDPNGIRPAFYYQDDEVLVVASERPAISTTFNVNPKDIKEVKPAHALIIKKSGQVKHIACGEPAERLSCSFERIYFSRGNDEDIYKERKKLGFLLCDAVLKAVDHDMERTIFSFIPNTAEIAYYGLVEGVNEYLKSYRKEQIKKMADGGIAEKELERIFNLTPRTEKIAHKDIKLRTFITEDSSRDELVSHVYDVTYGLIKPKQDTIVALDDSIVRGTTLKTSILSILDRLKPKKILIVSSAPQIRYPDCYGIDMSRMQEFIAFRAAIALLKERNMDHVIAETYQKCKAALQKPLDEIENEVKAIYAPFTDEEVSNKIAELLKPDHVEADVQIMFQTIEHLHEACPDHTGDWYFSGNFPTRGGNKVVNQSFINYYEGKNKRAY